jgi:hypothetical protein
MVADNPAKPLEESHRICKASACAGDAKTHREWDAEYGTRAADYPTFVVCRKLWSDLCWSAPVLTDEDLEEAFGDIPGSQNPGSLLRAQFLKLLRRLRINIELTDD